MRLTRLSLKANLKVSTLRSMGPSGHLLPALQPPLPVQNIPELLIMNLVNHLKSFHNLNRSRSAMQALPWRPCKVANAEIGQVWLSRLKLGQKR